MAMKNILAQRRAIWLTGAVLVAFQNAARACPGCKQVDGAPLSGASVGFGWDIFFMLFMIGSLLGGLSFMIYRSCLVLAERDRLLADDESLAAGELA
jgi:hypothetical protein